MSKDQALLEACTILDFDSVKNLLAEDADPGYQDPATGYGPLHRLVLAAHDTGKVAEAKEIVEYLLGNGAVWIQCTGPIPLNPVSLVLFFVLCVGIVLGLCWDCVRTRD